MWDSGAEVRRAASRVCFGAMPIDGCEHDFLKLASTVLPAHMDRLRERLSKPMTMADFCQANFGVRSLLKKHGHAADFSGCYVLLDDAPAYVGISRGVFKRLRNHVLGDSHNTATLAYRMAAEERPFEGSRSDAMADPVFRAVFEAKRAYVRSMRVAAVEIENPVELYVFEVFAALELRTKTWNTFRTH